MVPASPRSLSRRFGEIQYEIDNASYDVRVVLDILPSIFGLIFRSNASQGPELQGTIGDREIGRRLGEFVVVVVFRKKNSGEERERFHCLPYCLPYFFLCFCGR